MNLSDQLRFASLANATRRTFLGQGLAGLGSLWLGSELANAAGAVTQTAAADRPLAPRAPQLAAKAKRVIYLHMCGAPSQLEMFEHKPELKKYDGKDCPQELLEGNRFAFIRGVPKLMASIFPFHRAGESGAWVSDRLPNFERVIDKVSFIRTMQTEQFNHAPAQLLAHTGNQNLGYASIGSWVTYGLGTENQNLPGFVVLLSGGKFPDAGKSVWNSGFLPGIYQGVQCRSHGDPVLFLKNPPDIDRPLREQIIKAINQVNQESYAEFGDKETVTRISQYELAFRMQVSASDALDLSPGVEPRRKRRTALSPGKRVLPTIACWRAGWSNAACASCNCTIGAGTRTAPAENEALNIGFVQKCKEIDRPIAALLTDLEQRGLLEDTLVVWASEFGRTPMRENRGGKQSRFIGRDHHPHAFTCWLAGAGVKPGVSYGETDPVGFHAVTESVYPRDFQATLLHLMGIDHREAHLSVSGPRSEIDGGAAGSDC